jgi:predicted nucleic acid-binding protein
VHRAIGRVGTALVAGSAVATLNVDEFRRVPGLQLAELTEFVRR